MRSSRRIVEAVSVAAQGLGYSPLEVALAWVRDFPGVTSAVVGARTGAQMRGFWLVKRSHFQKLCVQR
jgi:aryl-alcohol dehydrogenase-like predicted oxidoreductase